MCVWERGGGGGWLAFALALVYYSAVGNLLLESSPEAFVLFIFLIDQEDTAAS